MAMNRNPLASLHAHDSDEEDGIGTSYPSSTSGLGGFRTFVSSYISTTIHLFHLFSSLSPLPDSYTYFFIGNVLTSMM